MCTVTIIEKCIIREESGSYDAQEIENKQLVIWLDLYSRFYAGLLRAYLGVF